MLQISGIARTVILLALLSALLAGSRVGRAEGPGALTVDALRNAEYTSLLYADGKVKPPNGEYRESYQDSPGELVISLSSLMAFGDLDGDGVEDAAVVLMSSGGGSGTFFDLIAVLNKDGQPVEAADAPLGDRIELRSLVIDDGKVVLQIVTQGPEDGLCCPTLKVRSTYALEDQDWIEISSEEQGTVSLADLEGVTWQLFELNEGKRALTGTAVTAVFAGNKIRGTAGCNTYSAALTPGEGQRVIVGPIMSTKKACPEPVMSQETEYLAALSSVVQWGFQDGNLFLFAAETVSDTARLTTLLFAAEP